MFLCGINLSAPDAGRFGCDVGKYLHRKPHGLMSLDVFDYDLVFGTNPHNMDKKSRLEYGESLMTHAMVVTAYDKGSDDKPARWRVENSWGTEDGDAGVYCMEQTWFDEFLCKYRCLCYFPLLGPQFTTSNEIRPDCG